MKKLSYAEAKLAFKKFPQIKETVYDKQRASLPLEAKQRHKFGLINYYRTADRMPIYNIPVNGIARQVTRLSQKKKSSKPGTIVYLVRFTSITNPTHHFLKIGITNSIKTRFEMDCYRYNLVLLASTNKMSRKEASELEKSLHSMFDDKRYVPDVRLLSNGNTECFVDDPVVVNRTLEFLTSKNYVLA